MTSGFWIFENRHAPNAPKKTCSEIYFEMLDAKRGAGVSDITLRNMKQYLGRWIGDAGDTPAHEIETVHLEKWMDSQPHPITGEHRKNFRRLFRQFFKFGMDRKYLRHNPAHGIQRGKGARKMPGIISAGVKSTGPANTLNGSAGWPVTREPDTSLLCRADRLAA